MLFAHLPNGYKLVVVFDMAAVLPADDYPYEDADAPRANEHFQYFSAKLF